MCSAIAHVRYIKILILLWGFLVIFLYFVWFSLCWSLFWEFRDNGVVKNLRFCAESLEVMLEFKYIERDGLPLAIFFPVHSNSPEVFAIVNSAHFPFRFLTNFKGRCTLGDKLQQQVATTDHSVCTGPATSCNNMSRRHIAATNRFLCTGEIFWKSLSLQQNFVAAARRTNFVWFDFLPHVAATKFRCRDQDFHNNSPVHTKQFVAATCRRDLLLQLVAWCVPT